MKSIEIKFNEALTELKAKASATKYNEVSEKLSTLPTIETKLNCVEAAIAQAVKESDPFGSHELDEALSDPSVAILFGREPKQATTKEAAPVVKKHNGAVENFVEGSPLNEGRRQVITETNTRKNIFAKGDAIMIENMTHPITKQPLTEAEKRSLTGGKPAEYGSLTERQKKEFDGARLFNISEADSLKLAKMAR